MAKRGAYVLLLTLATVSGATVFAHMKATKTVPAANATVATSPDRIQVWFTQAPDPKVSKLELAGPAGAVALTGFQVTAEKALTARIEGGLSDGGYTVRWQSAGDDGHIQKGEFTFTVKRAR